MTDYKYIDIKWLGKSASGKTDIYSVLNKSGNYELAIIKWYASWRQYCFFPGFETVWNDGCLRDLLDFMSKLRKGKK